MVHVVVAVEHVAPPGAAVAVYAVIGEPPSEAGAVHATAAAAVRGPAVTPVDRVGRRRIGEVAAAEAAAAGVAEAAR